jgi:hypothetical protein
MMQNDCFWLVVGSISKKRPVLTEKLLNKKVPAGAKTPAGTNRNLATYGS